MKILDKIELKLISGKGGDGYVDFDQLDGMPWGGNGGDGGNIYLVGDSKVNTVLHLSGTGLYQSEKGQKGKPQRGGGKNGKHVYLNVPIGAIIKTDNEEIIIKSHKPFLILSGGKGGLGNNDLWRQKKIGNERKLQHHAEKGELGKEIKISIEVSVLADAGFVGKPSAGKSTLLSVISNAKPKIADYHFTTLKPQLGIVKLNDDGYVVADLPGLIKGASQGKGLGIEFLELIAKCKIIVHVLDFSDQNDSQIDDFIDIQHELKLFDEKLLDLPLLVVANKIDQCKSMTKIGTFKRKFPDLKIVKTSGLTKQGIMTLKNEISKLIKLK